MGTALVFFLEGLLFGALSVPLIQRRVRPNHWYGFRTRKTFSSERIWYAANQFAGAMLFVAGAVIAGCSLLFTPLLLIPRTGEETYAAVMVACTVASTLAALVLSLIYLRKL